MTVSLVIPGRNSAATIGPCLEAVLPLLESGELTEILFVDDGSTDETRTIVSNYPVRLIAGAGCGPGAARNLGWRTARGELIWFMDSDCAADRNALALLRTHLDDEQVGAVGGSLTNMTPESLLTCLTHEEIVERHRRMGPRVDFLSAANVLYRRSVLEQTGGFDEQFIKAQDAELAWRVKQAGYELAFERRATVGHHYHRRWGTYLYSQAQQGYWRVFLHLTHAGHGAGDSYSSALDHLQPPLAMLILVGLAGSAAPTLRPYGIPLVAALLGLLAVAQIPLVWRLVRRTRQIRYAAFAGMNMLRSFWRGVGMTLGLLAFLCRRRRTASSGMRIE